MPRPTRKVRQEEGWQETRAREQPVQAQEVLPLHRRRREGDRLQGHRGPQGLHPGERQDHAGAHHRHQGALPAPAGDRDQARALPRARSRTPTCTDAEAAMQIILLEKVVNVGDLGDVVKVKQGYARNYLIPQGKAKRATPENIKLLEAKRAELEKAAAARARPPRRNRRRSSRACASRSRRRPASTGACSARSPTSTSSRR